MNNQKDQMKKAVILRNKLDEAIEKKSSPVCVVIVGKNNEWMNAWFPKRLNVIFPEKDLSIEDQAEYMTKTILEGKELTKNLLVITRSPWIVSDFEEGSVLIVKDSKIETPYFQTFGASVNKITMSIFDRRETCSNKAIALLKNIQKRIKLTKDLEKLESILDNEIHKTLGDSIEKVMLTKTLLDKIDRIKKGSANE